MNMKIKLSKSQWNAIGKKAGWIKKASFDFDQLEKNALDFDKKLDELSLSTTNKTLEKQLEKYCDMLDKLWSASKYEEYEKLAKQIASKLGISFGVTNDQTNDELYDAHGNIDESLAPLVKDLKRDGVHWV